MNDAAVRSDVRRGSPMPLGASARFGGVNFALFSRHATRVRLELYERPADAVPVRAVDLDPERHRTGDVWHVWLGGIRPGQLYGYRVEGPYRPLQGHRFDVAKLLLDPYAKAIAPPPDWSFGPAQRPAASAVDDAPTAAKCIVVSEDVEWGDDRPPKHPWSRTIIYETHVRGFTVHESSGVSHPGTYRGLAEKIPYLKRLGVTAVELMPVQEFNERGDGARRNYWGYEPVAFFAPKGSYAGPRAAGRQTAEFKEMVRALHGAGIEVILDVVFNHTAEGDESGPTLSWRGIANSIFYMLAEDRRRYRDFTGTGNTINANHPVVRDQVLDALRHWVVEMHVDGFRFDLAAVLGRDEDGTILRNAPLLERIAQDPILRDAKLIAEAWDAGGAYEVGSFAGRRWTTWNGRFRDDVRRFWRGDDGMAGALASRICGSSDVFAGSGKGPECGVNFLTSHDGFTLNDLVSFRSKHNEANGENNRDGAADDYSDNYGVEGPTHDSRIDALRVRQIKNFFLTLLISRGVPMVLGGDEFRRTQRGNNNPYGLDDETSWYDWALLDRHAGVHRFVREMIAFRREHPVLGAERYYTESDIAWFAPGGGSPAWTDPRAKAFACRISEDGGSALYLAFNADDRGATFPLPEAPGGSSWKLAVDTSRETPADIVRAVDASAESVGTDLTLDPKSSTILAAGP